MEDVGWVNGGSNTGKQMSVTTRTRSDEPEIDDVGGIPSGEREASAVEEVKVNPRVRVKVVGP